MNIYVDGRMNEDSPQGGGREMKEPTRSSPCIACGKLTDNTEHVCTNCTAGARARLRARQLTDDQVMPKPRGGDQRSDQSSRDDWSNVALAEEMGIGEATVRRARMIEISDRGYPNQARKNRQAEAAKLKTNPPSYPAGVYSTVVIDPPWPMVKIEREVRPNQEGFDYPTMSLDDIEALPIPGLLADDAFVLLWTTQKFLPSCFELLEAWGLGYRWTMVWHKPGGYQPYNSPQFNAEFVVAGTQGNPRLADAKAFPVAFEAPRGAHSEKPQAFYDLVGRTLGLGLDMFARSKREGWAVWGDEV